MNLSPGKQAEAGEEAFKLNEAHFIPEKIGLLQFAICIFH
jgi:hypothetical protein